MYWRNRIVRCLLSVIVAYSFIGTVAAQAINLQPKYGSVPNNEMQKTADDKFLADADSHFKGDRKKAASQVAQNGWKYLRQGNFDDAMRRFNQAWLLDPANGSAIWGMAAYQAQTGKTADAFSLFSEADGLIGEDVDFQADYARLQGFVGAQAKDEARLQDAYKRFARVYEKLPQHVMNLQNWAITLFLVGNYVEAWKKIKEAEAAPRHAELDQKFISDLSMKMPRP